MKDGKIILKPHKLFIYYNVTKWQQMDIHVFGQISHIRLELPPTEIVSGDGGIEVALVKNLDLM